MKIVSGLYQPQRRELLTSWLDSAAYLAPPDSGLVLLALARRVESRASAREDEGRQRLCEDVLLGGARVIACSRK